MVMVVTGKTLKLQELLLILRLWEEDRSPFLDKIK